MKHGNSRYALLIDMRKVRKGDSIGYELEHYCDTEYDSDLTSAMARIRQRPPHFICFECDVPTASDLESLQWFRLRFPAIPLLMATVQHSEALAVWAFRAGVWDFLVRPVAPEELRLRIKQVTAVADEAIISGAARSPMIGFHPVPDHVARRTNAPDAALLDMAISYVERNFFNQVTLAQMAEVTGMSSYGFSRLFKKRFGQSFQEYLTQRRMSEAVNLLHNPCATLGDIAAAIGFSDPPHFSRMFKKFTGFTPTEFRDHIDELNPPIANAESDGGSRPGASAGAGPISADVMDFLRTDRSARKSVGVRHGSSGSGRQRAQVTLLSATGHRRLGPAGAGNST